MQKKANNRSLIPSRKQWEGWSLPSKLTAVGTLVGVMSLLITILVSSSSMFESTQRSFESDLIGSGPSLTQEDDPKAKANASLGLRNVPIDFHSICREIPNSFNCASRVEAISLPRYPDFASRTDSTLNLYLADGSVHELENIDKGAGYEDEIVYYFFRDYMPELGYFIVTAQFYDSIGYFLISRQSGSQQFIWGIPILSPDRSEIVVANKTDETGMVPAGISIYDVRRDKLVLDWEWETNNHDIWSISIENESWNDPDIIQIEISILFDAEIVHRFSSVIKENGQWKFAYHPDDMFLP